MVFVFLFLAYFSQYDKYLSPSKLLQSSLLLFMAVQCSIEYTYHICVIIFTWKLVLFLTLFLNFLSQQKFKGHTLV